MSETKIEETGTPQESKPEEIDFDRIKNGDEEYTKQVNERLAKESTEPAAPAPNVEPAPPPAPPEEDFYNFDDGDPVYRGEPFKVKKSELKAYVQKGRHLETRLSEVSPLLNVIKSNPGLADAITRAAKDPAGAEQLRRIDEAIRSNKITSQVEDDLSDLDLPGLNKDDVQAVAKIQLALRQREEKKRQESEQAHVQEEIKRRDYHATAMVEGLRAIEGATFEKVRPVMQQRVQQLRAAVDQGALDEAQYNQFVIGLTDPTATDDQGKPLFVRFYEDTKAEMLGASTPAPPPQSPPRGAPTINARMTPGSASPPGRSGESSLDWQNMSQTEFERRISEKLAAL